MSTKPDINPEEFMTSFQNAYDTLGWFGKKGDEQATEKKVYVGKGYTIRFRLRETGMTVHRRRRLDAMFYRQLPHTGYEVLADVMMKVPMVSLECRRSVYAGIQKIIKYMEEAVSSGETSKEILSNLFWDTFTDVETSVKAAFAAHLGQTVDRIDSEQAQESASCTDVVVQRLVSSLLEEPL